MSMPAVRRYSVADYLALEEASDERHEYYDGEIFAMAGGSANHNLIATNLAGEVRNALKGSGCRVFNSDMKVATPTGLRTYPDVSVACGGAEYEDEKQLTLLNPLLVVEVLSETTEAFDRGKKFEHYRSIESLQAYVLIAQDRTHVDHFARRPDGGWVLTAVGEIESVVALPALQCSIPMAEVYANVEFAPPEEASKQGS